MPDTPDGTPGPAPEAAGREELAEWLFATYRRSKAEWLELSADSQGRWRQDAIDLLSFLRAAPLAAPREPSEAYEQAANWCEERAAKIRARAVERPDAYDRQGAMLADWIQGDADTIRFNAGLRAVPSVPPSEASETSLFDKCQCGHDYGHHSTKDDHCCKRDCPCVRFVPSVPAPPSEEPPQNFSGNPKLGADAERREPTP